MKRRRAIYQKRVKKENPELLLVFFYICSVACVPLICSRFIRRRKEGFLSLSYEKKEEMKTQTYFSQEAFREILFSLSFPSASLSIPWIFFSFCFPVFLSPSVPLLSLISPPARPWTSLWGANQDSFSLSWSPLLLS